MENIHDRPISSEGVYYTILHDFFSCYNDQVPARAAVTSRVKRYPDASIT